MLHILDPCELATAHKEGRQKGVDEDFAVEGDAVKPAWYTEVARWTYQSSMAFIEHLTVTHATLLASNGEPQRILKLGSCWGGWDCNNPSYHAPAHWRAFRDFMLKHDATCAAFGARSL